MSDRIAPMDRITEIEWSGCCVESCPCCFGQRHRDGFTCDMCNGAGSVINPTFAELISIARTAIAERDAIFTAGPSLLKGLEGVPSYPADIRKHADELRGNAYYRVREFLKQTGRGEFQPGYLPSVIEYLSEYAAARIRGEREAAYRKGLDDAAAVCDKNERVYRACSGDVPIYSEGYFEYIERANALKSAAASIRALAAPLTKG